MHRSGAVGLFGRAHRRIRCRWIRPSELWLQEPAVPRVFMRAETALPVLALAGPFIDLNDPSGVRWPSGLGRTGTADDRLLRGERDPVAKRRLAAVGTPTAAMCASRRGPCHVARRRSCKVTVAICVLAHRPDIRRGRSWVIDTDKPRAPERRPSGNTLSVRTAKPAGGSHGLTDCPPFHL